MDQFFFESPSFTTGSFRVLSLVGEEAMSMPFRFEIVALAVDLEADTVEDQVLGHAARLQIVRHDGDHRSIVGVVRSIRLEGVEDTATERFRIELVPPLWHIGERFRSRVFQDLTVPQIVQTLLDELHVRFDFRLSMTYRPRRYCVQYRERDVDFISRILAEEGIFFYFVGDDAAMTMVFGDADTAYHRLAGTDDVLNFSDGTFAEHAEHIAKFVVQREVRNGSVMLRDYDFTRPSLDLTSQVVVETPSRLDSPGVLERYEHPGGYTDPDDGRARARLRLEELRWDATRAVGAGTTRRLEPGFTFTLDDHPIERFNRRWVVTRVRHEGREGGLEPTAGAFTYQANFQAVRASTTFRPKPLPKPNVRGIETARVTGDGGDEIRVDDLGRVQVRFFWDRDGLPDAHSSCFIRVSQGWAGTGFGIWFLPRVGMEVVVAFLGGDPDQPLVTGCVYNGEHPLPYKLPEHKTRSTIKTLSSPGGNGFNELRFEDLAKQEQIFLHAQRNLDEQINVNHSTNVGANQSDHVGHDQSTTVDHDQTTTVRHDQSFHVLNDQTVTVDQNRALTVGGNEQTTIGADRLEKVCANEAVVIDGGRFHRIQEDDELIVLAGHAVSVAEIDSLVANAKKASIATKYEIDVGALYSATTKGGAELKLENTEASVNATTVGLFATDTLTLFGNIINAIGIAGVKVESTSGSVTLVVGGSSVTVDKTGISLKTGGKIVLEAPDVQIIGKSTASVIGAAVNVGDGQGVVTIRGAPVKVNV